MSIPKKFTQEQMDALLELGQILYVGRWIMTGLKGKKQPIENYQTDISDQKLLSNYDQVIRGC